MDHDLPDVTDAEAAVLQRLWDAGPATARRLRDALYPGGGPSEHATVHKLLDRLEAKGYVGRARVDGALLFRAVVERDQALGRKIAALLDKLAGGSLQPLLTNLVRVKRVTADDLRELLAFVEDLERKKKSKRDRR
ncbi:MAG TPA: BlaI/MecI/CopY family transcriptional regulator [Gemmataceae bacterium]|nr:BlaI/MecI/CopY family transcriptional regulator [Gemmataceae bacterium]